MINRYSEEYIGDAIALCKHFKKDGDSLGVVLARVEDFPSIPKTEMGEVGYAVRLFNGGEVIMECLYRTTDKPENKKHLGGWLVSAMVGESIKKARLDKGMTLEELSDLSGYTTYSLNAMEKGRYNLNLRVLGVIASCLGCSVGLTAQ